MLGGAIFFLMLATLMIPATVLVMPQYVTVADLPILHVFFLIFQRNIMAGLTAGGIRG